MHRPNLKHGLYTMKKAVAVLGNRALPGADTALGQELQAWRAALIADLGGEDAITTQQRALIDLAVRSKLLIDSVDAYILSMESPVNRRRRCLHPVVVQRTSLSGHLQTILKDLGLERRSRPVEDLRTYVARRAAEREEASAEKGEKGEKA